MGIPPAIAVLALDEDGPIAKEQGAQRGKFQPG